VGYAPAYPYLMLIRHSLYSIRLDDLTANAKFKIINDLLPGQNLMKDVIFPWPKRWGEFLWHGVGNIMNAVGVSLDLFMGQARAAG